MEKREIKRRERPAPEVPGPAAVISRRAADRLQAGHVWVYRSDVESLVPRAGDAELAAGELASVHDWRGAPLGAAMYSSKSQICLRMIAGAPQALASHEDFLELLRTRILRAIALRLPMFDDNNNAARIIFSEADELPGLIVDRYADIVVMQRNTQGLAGSDVAECITQALLEGFGDEHHPAMVLEQSDARIREIEELPLPSAEPLYLASAVTRDAHPPRTTHQEAADPAHAPQVQTQTEFRLNSLRFAYDARSGQKTGAFLDQRLNYAAAAHWASQSPLVNGVGRALDMCTYQGGFALHLARVCVDVTAVDASLAALEIAQQNEHTNRDQLHAKEINWLQGDAFVVVRDFAAMGEQFSAIVLDPPAFAKTQRAAEGALRGYKELNLRAMQMLVPGGILVTCSCSHHVSLQDFTAIVASAAADARRHVTLLETRTAAPDHPIVLGIPETHYLKCLICRVD